MAFPTLHQLVECHKQVQPQDMQGLTMSKDSGGPEGSDGDFRTRYGTAAETLYTERCGHPSSITSQYCAGAESVGEPQRAGADALTACGCAAH